MLFRVTFAALTVRGEWVFKTRDVAWKLPFKTGGVAGYYPPSGVMRESGHPVVMSSGRTCLSQPGCIQQERNATLEVTDS